MLELYFFTCLFVFPSPPGFLQESLASCYHKSGVENAISPWEWLTEKCWCSDVRESSDGDILRKGAFLSAPKPHLVDFCLHVGPALSSVVSPIISGFALSGLLPVFKSVLKNNKWKIAEINNLCFKLFNIFSNMMKSLTFTHQPVATWIIPLPNLSTL